MAVAYLFPGQGSQSAGMGADLFDDFPELEATADRVLGYPVRELCLNDAARLRRTEYAQPALYVVSAMAYHSRAAQPVPDVCAGHSLGEYSALFAAGCFDFETGLRLVRRRGELMAACPPGAMTAVLGVARGRLDELRGDEVDIANHNTPEQWVLAGPPNAMRGLQDAVADRGLGKAVPLNVSVAAHSRLMAEAAREFADELRAVRFAEPRIPVIANATAEPYTAATAADLLTRQLTDTVRWWDTLCLLAARGVDRIVELGPGQVLARMWDKSRAYLPVPADLTPAGRTTARAVQAAPATPVIPAALADRAPAPPPLADDAGQALGDAFRAAHGLRLAYLAGAMGYGVSGPALLRHLSDAGLLGFLGTAGRPLSDVDGDLAALAGVRYGVNLPVGVAGPARVRALVDLAVRYGVGYAEAPAHVGVTAELLCWRFGADPPAAGRHLVVKAAGVARAAAFLRPAPAALVERLRAAGELSDPAAEAARRLPVATAVCAETQSGWLAGGDGGPGLLPAVVALREQEVARHGYRVWVGASGGTGCPATVAAHFLAGAEFVLTGSVNQCTPQAATSEAVKELLSVVDIDDTSTAPAGELFELGGRTRVVSRRGVLFPARAAALYRAYRRHGGLGDLDRRTRRWCETECLGRPLEEVAAQVAAGEPDGRRRMALVFGHYFDLATRAALQGDLRQRANWQIPCGPAMGAFNRSVAGTPLADWRERHADAVAGHLMSGAARMLGARRQAVAA